MANNHAKKFQPTVPVSRGNPITDFDISSVTFDLKADVAIITWDLVDDQGITVGSDHVKLPIWKDNVDGVPRTGTLIFSVPFWGQINGDELYQVLVNEGAFGAGTIV